MFYGLLGLKRACNWGISTGLEKLPDSPADLILHKKLIML